MSVIWRTVNAAAWLPERLHDIIFRVGAQEKKEGSEKTADHIYFWEENGEIEAFILPDGENIYVAVRNVSILDFREKPLIYPESEEHGSWVS